MYCGVKCSNYHHALVSKSLTDPESIEHIESIQTLRCMDNVDHGLLHRMREFMAPMTANKRHQKEYLHELELLGQGQWFANIEECSEQICGRLSGVRPVWPLGKRGQTLFPPFEKELTTMLHNMGIKKNEDEFESENESENEFKKQRV